MLQLVFYYIIILYYIILYYIILSRSLHSASEQRITVPSQRGTKSLSQTFSLTVPIWWNDLPNSIRAAESLPIFKKRLKNTSLPSLFDPNSSTLYSNFIVSNLSSFYKKKKPTHLTLYQLHIYSLTASFSCKTNTELFFLYSIYLFSLKKQPSYVRRTRTCNSTCILLLFCWFDCLYNVLICKSLWIKASAK